jgi:hypothetical protein
MLKKLLIPTATLLIYFLVLTAAKAEIIPPQGPGQGGLQAVVLCDSLTLRKGRSTSSESIQALPYGSLIVVQTVEEGWAYCAALEGTGAVGWVKSDYLVLDPAWYVCDETIPVFAYGDTVAPKLALLSRGDKLPIIKDEGDWLIVSLRGAAGWIYKTAKDRTDANTISAVASLSKLEKAELLTPKGAYTLTDPAGLAWIEENFSIAQPIMSAGCPFDAVLTLYRADGSEETLYMATDGCRNFRTLDGSYFAFGNGDEALRLYDSTSIIGETFWKLFGLTTLYEDIY